MCRSWVCQLEELPAEHTDGELIILFRGKLFQLTELVAELGRLLHQQWKTHAQLPQLQPSLCRKATMLHREVMPGFSEASCNMWLKSCAPFMRGMRPRSGGCIAKPGILVAYFRLQSGFTVYVFPIVQV